LALAGTRAGRRARRLTVVAAWRAATAKSKLVAVMGPSGAGKSTLLHLAGGLDRPGGGRIRVAGTDLGGLGRGALATLRRRRVGYVFQELNLLGGLTAAENVALPRELDGVRARTARAEALAALELVGVAALAGKFPEQLSGGEQQRVAIARAGRPAAAAAGRRAHRRAGQAGR
jgi:putative ABC transport system ATP-binding protein